MEPQKRHWSVFPAVVGVPANNQHAGAKLTLTGPRLPAGR